MHKENLDLNTFFTTDPRKGAFHAPHFLDMGNVIK